MKGRVFAVLIALLGSAAGGIPVAQDEPVATDPTIVLDKEIFLTDSEGEAVAVQPGTYALQDVGEEGLRLISRATGDSIVLMADSGPHEEEISEAKAIAESTEEEPDAFYLTLLLPDGTGVYARGSETAPRSGAAIQFRGATAMGGRTVSLDSPAFFASLDGSTVKVEPGRYMVEGAEKGQLRLVPKDPDKAVLIVAAEGRHEQEVSEPLAATEPGEEGSYYVVLLFPDGISLYALGSDEQPTETD